MDGLLIETIILAVECLKQLRRLILLMMPPLFIDSLLCQQFSILVLNVVGCHVFDNEALCGTDGLAHRQIV